MNAPTQSVDASLSRESLTAERHYFHRAAAPAAAPAAVHSEAAAAADRQRVAVAGAGRPWAVDPEVGHRRDRWTRPAPTRSTAPAPHPYQ